MKPAQKKATPQEPIAIVGMSALFPGSVDRQRFWRNIVAGRDFITEVPPSHWLPDDYFDSDPQAKGKVYTRRGAFLPELPLNPMEFGIPPNNLPSTDTVQLLSLLGAKHLLEQTHCFAAEKVSRKQVGIILGVAAGTELIGQMVSKIQRPNWLEAMRRHGLPETEAQAICDHIEDTYPAWNEATFPGLLSNVAAGRVANRFDLGGTNCVIDAACASSLGAVSMAVDELRMGKADMVISGGADALCDIFMFMCFSKTPAISFTGDCRPFSDNADGTMMGEGLAMFALRRLSDAERDGDRIYALITGVGSSSDGKSKSVYAPVSEGQSRAIRRAWDQAGASPESIELIEAHGTATNAGDAAEFGGLKLAFGETSRKKPWCALGSIKSQIGHTKSSAGAAGLFKIAMAVSQKVLPPTIKVQAPNPNLKISESPLYLNTAARPWIHASDTPRRAGLSSFGFGGSNFHLVVEEYQNGENRKTYQSDTHLILIGAKTAKELETQAKKLCDLAENQTLGAAGRESQKTFQAKAKLRLAVVADDPGQFVDLLSQALPRIGDRQEESFSIDGKCHFSRAPISTGKVAFLFPGQGSQYPNMGSGLAREFDQARQIWDRSTAFELEDGTRLPDVVFPPPAFTKEDRIEQSDALKRTEWTQPALGCASLAQLAILDTLGLKPDAVAGHSYGELVALHAAGAIKTDDELLLLSQARGLRMAEASTNIAGAMTAILADFETVSSILDTGFENIAIANQNAPEQTVVAGRTEDIAALEKHLAIDVKLSFQRLPVATAFHSPIVAEVSSGFAQDLKPLRMGQPKIPVYANSTAEPYPKTPAAIKKLLAEQLALPVRFRDQIQAMADDGISVFVEVGAGSTLSSLTRSCLADSSNTVVALDTKNETGLQSFWQGIAALSLAGLPLDFPALWEQFEPDLADFSKKPLGPGEVHFSGANIGKKYPPAEGASGKSKPNLSTPKPISSPSASGPSPALSSNMSSDNIQTSDTEARLRSLERIQQNMMKAHSDFQNALSQSHQAFIRASEQLIAQLGGSSFELSSNPAKLEEQSMDPPPIAPITQYPTPTTQPPTSRRSALHQQDAKAEEPPPQDPTPRTFEPRSNPAKLAERSTGNYKSLILSTVAEKTGYPEETIGMQMDLEAELGIDSIKKVEIFSALQESIPEYADADASQLGELSTIEDILAFTKGIAGSQTREGTELKNS